MKPLYVPLQQTRVETTVVNSRFITTLAPAHTVEQAKSFINLVKNEFNDASHNVPAFIIGHGSSVIAHSSDDGEPSGTAGRPVLAVMAGSGLGDVVVVVTRYFGGTKLGKGGLVRAYGDAVRMVLRIVPIAEKVMMQTIMFGIPYSYFEQAKLLITKFQAIILDQAFMDDITITCKLRPENLPGFKMNLSEMTSGKVEIIQLEPNAATLLPIPSPPHFNK